jgi:hypothetical protein
MSTDCNKCGICFDTLRLPYTFNCGHSLCISCTAVHIKINTVCPFCRQQITSVSPNYALRAIVYHNNETESLTEQELRMQSDIQSFSTCHSSSVNRSSSSENPLAYVDNIMLNSTYNDTHLDYYKMLVSLLMLLLMMIISLGSQRHR